MGIENEVHKARLAKAQAENPTPTPDYNQMITDRARESGLLDDLETLRKMTGDPNARIQPNGTGFTLVWDEVPDQGFSYEQDRKILSKTDKVTPSPVGADGRQTISRKTESRYQATQVDGYTVKSDRTLQVYVDPNKGPSISREQLAQDFVEADSNAPNQYSKHSNSHNLSLEERRRGIQPEKRVYTGRDAVEGVSVDETSESVAVTEGAKRAERQKEADARRSAQEDERKKWGSYGGKNPGF